MKKLTRFITGLVVALASSAPSQAQTSIFTYQGKLDDAAAAANGMYQMQFALFPGASTGSQIGPTLTFDGSSLPAVQVTNGIFTVQLDFGSSPFGAGADRFLEISVKHAADPGYTTLAPRQQLTSSPYSIRTVSAGAADSLSSNCVGCVTDAQIDGVDGSKVTGTVANATNANNATDASQLGGVAANQYVITSDSRLSDARPPTAGSANYIQNTTSQQTASFNVSGSGTVGGAFTANTVSTNSANNLIFAGQSSSTSGSWLSLTNTSSGGNNWSIISTGSGNSEGTGKLLFNDQTNGGTILQLDSSSATVNGTTALVPPAGLDSAAAVISMNGSSASFPSRFALNNDGGLLLTGTNDGGISGGIPLEGAGTRLIWYPRKSAFRVGTVTGTQWDDPNVGLYSSAFGNNVRASGDDTFAAGQETVAAGSNAMALGQFCTASGAASVALGYYAHTNARQGSFVFSDRSVVDDGNIATDESFRASVNHSFNVRATGGYYLFTNTAVNTGLRLSSNTGNNVGSFVWTDRSADSAITPTAQNQTIFRSSGGYFLYSNTNLTAGVTLPAGGGAWSSVSDRNVKANFKPVDTRAILRRVVELPISTWNYKSQDETIRHIGPMAQDFQAAFGVGEDDKHISTIDPDGVVLAAIQGLEEQLEERADSLKQEKDRQIETLTKRVAELEKLVNKLGEGKK